MAERSFADIFIEQIEEAGDEAYKLIEKFIKEARAEDLYLDFKEKEDRTKAALSTNDERNLAKAISGFAHSDGGLIVWGIEARRKGNDSESPDVARSLKPVKNLNAFHANLNDKIRLATTPPVPGVRNFKVSKPPKAKEGYVVTLVPTGPVPPYRAEKCNNHFYKRSGSNFYHMEPFDIRDLVSRGQYPKVSIVFDWNINAISGAGMVEIYDLIVRISNAGPTVLEVWKLILEVPKAIFKSYHGNTITQSGNVQSVSSMRADNEPIEILTFTSHPGRGAYSASVPIFPEEKVNFISPEPGGIWDVRYQVFQEIVDKGGKKITWRLYGSNMPSQSGEIHIDSGSFCNF